MDMLLDLENRIKQFIEVNQKYLDDTDASVRRESVQEQNATYNDILGLIKQLKKTGKINRGNEYFPDAIEPMVTKHKWLTIIGE